MRIPISGASLFLAATALAAAVTPIGAQQGQIFHPRTSPTDLRFEVATIKPNDDPRPGLNFALSVGNFSAKQATLKDLLMLAYNFRSDYQIVGLSAWMTSAPFSDIKAKAS